MTDGGLHWLTALQACECLALAELTSEALVTHLLDRIERLDPALHALVAVHPEALHQARESDARRASGRARGLLDGVPVVITDNVEVVGLPGCAGSLALRDSPALRDAPLVTRLREAGLEVLAAANLSEWANFRGRNSTSGWSAVGGLTDNPWQPGRSAGGSSSGSGAAVAAGLAPLAVGTETDGSITCPASLCGVVGFKPTVGTVPVDGVVPIAASQDTPGPMARTVADVALLQAVMVGEDPEQAVPDLAHSSPRRFVLGAPSAWLTGDSGTDALFAASIDALRSAGIAVVHVDVPAEDDEVGHDEVTVLVHEMADDLDAYLAQRPGPGPSSVVEVVEFNDAHADRELAHFGQEYLVEASASRGRADPRYVAARARNLAWAVDEVLVPAFSLGVDALIAPAYAPAWVSRLDQGDRFAGGAVTTAPSIAGWPLATVPMGLVDGLPVGMAIVGPERGDHTVLAVASAIEAAVGWAHRAPLA